MRKVFLKLDGVKGESPSARQAVEIEVSNFYWGTSRTTAHSLRNGRGRASKNGLTIIKRRDQTTPDFVAAALTGQSFQGFLTLEDFSASETLVRSIVFELQPVFVQSVTEIKNGEVISLSCRNIKLLRTAKGNAGQPGIIAYCRTAINCRTMTIIRKALCFRIWRSPAPG